MKKIIILTLALCFITTTIVIYSQNSGERKSTGTISGDGNYPKAFVSYDDFKALVMEVETHRASHLISFDKFIEMSKEDNVIILDARSDYRYNRKHIKGALHMDFTDFTQESLNKLIPDPNTKILIYCNNNIEEDQVDFPTKKSGPSIKEEGSLNQDKPVMLALNIPTYINLYGYGYKNIYELDELVNTNDTRIEFEGTAAK
jgi:hypothetical protein